MMEGQLMAVSSTCNTTVSGTTFVNDTQCAASGSSDSNANVANNQEKTSGCYMTQVPASMKSLGVLLITALTSTTLKMLCAYDYCSKGIVPQSGA